MAERGRTAILAVALSLAPAGAGFGGDAPVEQLYAVRCAFCHGEKGGADGLSGEALDPPPTDFTRPEFWRERLPEQIRAAIRDGKPGTAMVPFGGVLSPGEIEALADYLRGFARGEPTGGIGSRGAGRGPTPVDGGGRRDPR
jgi:cytochrome c oxidase cbb3-type subunit 3